MSGNLAIANGTIVNETGSEQKTLIIKDGIIADILPPDADVSSVCPDAEILDAEGKYVVPGGVDGHVHFGAFTAIPQADDFASGSRAALWGGTTTVVDFAQANEGETAVGAIRRYKKMAECSMVDYSFHLSFTVDYENELKELPEIAEEGITSFKLYTYYPRIALSPADFRAVFSKIHDKGTVLVHAEEKTIIDRLKSETPGVEGDYLALSLTRPSICEQISTEDILALAKESGTKICIAHTSAKETVAIRKREAKEGNEDFLLETCPHYCVLTREKLKGEDGALYTMNPPLRGKEDADALMEALLDEDISMLSTDHCVYLSKYKKDHTSYLTVPCGVDGAQTRMLFLFSEGVLKRGMSMEAFVRLTSSNAAKFYHFYPRKGLIAVGSDADLAIFDPEGEHVFTKDDIAGAMDYSIFEGMSFKGSCACTIKGGRVVMRDGVVTAEEGSGQFLFTKV